MRRSRLPVAVAVALGVTRLVACSRFSEDDAAQDPSGDAALPPGDATSNATTDATSGEPGSDGGVAAPPPVEPRLPNGDFEAPGGGCGPGWTSYGGVTYERVPGGTDGGSACRVCNQVVGTTKGIHRIVPHDGGATTATAWFHPAPDGGSVAKAWIFLYALYADGGGNPTPSSGQALVGGGWSPVSVSYPPAPGVTQLRLHLEAGEVGCLLFDDATLEP